MEKPGANPQQEHTLAWIEECLSVSKRKTASLQKNDLATLEDCLEQEAQLLSRRPIFHRTRVRIPVALVSELRSANEANRALIANGFDLARTLLNTIRPPATYSSQPGARIADATIDPVISVKC